MPAKTKRTRGASELDPVVETVRGVLEQSVQYFLDNIGAYIEKYKKSLDETTAIIQSQPKLTDAPPAAEVNPNGTVESAFPKDETKPAIPTVGGKVTISPTDDETVVEVEFPDNTDLKKQLKQLKREAYEMSTTLEGVVDWIDLNAPDKEKGQEDVGAEIQDAVSEQIASLADAVSSVYELEMKYLGERAELETTLLAMPEVKSIALSMEIHDSDMWDEVERSWKAMMRVCLIAYSVLSKNMSKLKNPVQQKSSATASIYQ